MSKKMPKKSVAVRSDLFDKLDRFFEKHQGKFFWWGMAFAFLFSILLFSVKMSEMGDDSGYVLRAFKLLKDGFYPVYQGPMYPFFLTPFMAVFGVKVIMFKFLSMVLILFFLYFFYHSLVGRIPYSLLVPIFLLTAINSNILFFSSQTFSEAAYLLMEVLMFWVLFRKDTWLERDFILRSDWKQFLLLGVIVFMGTLTRSVHLGAVIVLVLFFLTTGKWRSSLASLGSFGVIYLIWEGVKRIFWHNDLAQIAAQGKQMMLKNPYNPLEGMETFSGYIDRLFVNSKFYLTDSFLSMTGLRAEGAPVSGFLTLLIYALVFLALFLVLKKNKVLFFTILYVGVLGLVTFVVLQTFWAQWRLIAVFFPFLLLALLSVCYYGFKKYTTLQFVYPILLVVLLFAELGDTFGKVEKNLPTLKANLAGDTFADYAPEWKSFMQMSQMSAKQVPADVMIASRKPEMSFIYSGREFYGVYSVPEVTMDSIRSKFSTGSVLFGLNPMALAQTPLFQQISKSVLGFVQGTDNTITGIYQLDASTAASVLPALKTVGLTPDLQVMQTLSDKFNAGMELHVVDPEKLVQQFVKNNVRFVILNSPNLFGTLYRYLMFLQLKYPQSLTNVNAIGKDQAQTVLVEFHPENLN